jgi:hypothetical protein
MPLDPMNPVVALCAEGMAVEGDALAATALFEKAWDSRRDDFDAAVAAHFLARHQPTPELTLHWNALAVDHAARVTDGQAEELLASLYLNLGDSHHAVGNHREAATAVERARTALELLPAGGYRDFVAMGVDRLERRLADQSLGRKAADSDVRGPTHQ